MLLKEENWVQELWFAQGDFITENQPKIANCFSMKHRELKGSKKVPEFVGRILRHFC